LPLRLHSGEEKNLGPCKESNPDSPVSQTHSLVIILTTLARLVFPFIRQLVVLYITIKNYKDLGRKQKYSEKLKNIYY
jgi:hypothetical protein